jgi:ATP-dependent DNA helicase HFM1/MER3
VRNPYTQKKNIVVTKKVGEKHQGRSIHDNNVNCGHYNQGSIPNSFVEQEVPEEITRKQRKTQVNTFKERIIVDRPEKKGGLDSEISPALYAPPAYQENQRPAPRVTRFDHRSCPLHKRRTISVQSSMNIFSPSIVKALWNKKFDRFNHFQSEMFALLSNSDNNVVVSAPTGAGKSALFDVAVARFVSMDLNAQDQQHNKSTSSILPLSPKASVVSKARKIIYLAPSRALCQERYEEWSRQLEDANLGLDVALITGQEENDLGTSSFSDFVAAHLIITTPEKLDSMTRTWTEKFFLFASVKLLLLDEIHHLGDGSRGWCLESVLTRMKTIHRIAQVRNTTPDEIHKSSYSETNPDAVRSCLRIVAVSATLPNISDVADFLQAKEAFVFDDSYRPVPLTKHVNGLGRVGKNEWKFWSNLSDNIPEIIRRFSHSKQSLIFCHSKKETENITELLINQNFGNKGVKKLNPPWNDPVQYMVQHGIGYHHAGISKEHRSLVEEAFTNGRIKYLAATSTLAVGVNLPGTLT